MVTVRVLDSDDEPRSENQEQGQGQQRRSWWRRWAPAVVAAALVGGTGLGLWLRPSQPATPAASAPAPAPASGSVAQPAPGSSSAPGSGLYLAEVAPGLRMGLATVDSGNTAAKYGIPYGWSKTPEGAVGAAMHNAASFCSLPVLVDGTRAELVPYLFTPDGAQFDLTAERAAKMRKGMRLNDDGVVLLPDGQPSPHEKYYGCGLPRYGAYKVLASDPDRVVVEVWMPYVAGPGTDDNISEVWLGTLHGELTMRWSAGPDGPDWRVSYYKSLPALKLPASPKKSNIGWQGIRDVVGPGWMVPADATTQPYPGSVWAS